MLDKPSDDGRYVDLHIHTKHSDGTCTVEEVLQTAVEHGLQAISITDHDCIDAYPRALELGARMGIEVIPGVELSCDLEGVDIHVLGYCIDVENGPLCAKLREMKDARFVRARRIVENLNNMGMDLRFETVLKIAGDAAIGRPHIAAAMLQEELIYSFREAFDSSIGYDSPAYVDKLKIKPAEVFQLIRQAGGVPVLAHPAVTRVDEHIAQFIRDGLMGIEAMHSESSPAAERFYRQLARRNGLLVTGGSDFHTTAHSRLEIGHPRVPASFALALKGERAEYAR
jgi:predicted metal-dependent phosphoesterase TrpH